MVLAQGSMLQLVMGTLLSGVFLLVQVQASPYTGLSDDYLASGCSFGLVAIFLCSYAFKDAALIGLNDIQDKMSKEQREIYVVDQAMLSLVMMSSVLGALMLSCALFVIQFANEGARMRALALASAGRRLRYKESSAAVAMSALEPKHFHIFLSHVWGTGQDQMRIVKQRLLEMIPDLHAFLDVDDLEEIGALEDYILRTDVILTYCSKGYFTSKNCMREAVSSTSMRKPMIALIDPDASRGGLCIEQVKQELLEADELYARWGFNEGSDGLRSQALYDHLFAFEPIEWNRIGHFQDVTMRLIACRLLPVNASATYVDRELISQKLKPLPLPSEAFHVYCSAINPGLIELLEEVGRERGFQVTRESNHVRNKPHRQPGPRPRPACCT